MLLRASTIVITYLNSKLNRKYLTKILMFERIDLHNNHIHVERFLQEKHSNA